MSEETVVISVKVSGGTAFEVEADTDWHVLKLKEVCQEKCQIPVAQQRLIFKGKILKDGDKLSTHGVKTGQTMHLVKSAAQTQAPQNTSTQSTIPMAGESSIHVSSQIPHVTVFQSATPSVQTDNAGGGAATAEIQFPFDPQMFQGILNNLGGYMGGGQNTGNTTSTEGVPGTNSGRPNLIETLLSNMGAEQSDMGNIQQNFQRFLTPEMIQRTHQATLNILSNMRGPNNQQGTANLDVGAVGAGLGDNTGTSGGPENLNGLERLINNVMSALGDQFPQNMQNQPAVFGATVTGGASDPNIAVDSAGTAAVPGGAAAPNADRNNPTAGQNDRINASIYSNAVPSANIANQLPDALSPLSFVRLTPFSFNRRAGDLNPVATGGTAGDQRTPQQRYASQLSTLEEMGFIDSEANVQALQESNGDVNVAVSRLLERGMGN